MKKQAIFEGQKQILQFLHNYEKYIGVGTWTNQEFLHSEPTGNNKDCKKIQ
jgi:hypothetical protein